MLVSGGELRVQGFHYFGLLLRSYDDADSVRVLNYLGAGRGGVAELLTRLGTAMTREALTRQSGSAIPAFGNSVACDLRDDDVHVGGLDCLRHGRLFSTLAVLRKRLAGQHDRLAGWSAGLGGFVVGRGALYAVEGGSGGEAARNARGLLTVATTSSAISAVATATTVASVSPVSTLLTASAVVLPGAGGGIGRGNRGSLAGDGAVGCSIDIEEVILRIAGRKVYWRVGGGDLRDLVATALATATATAAAATPAATAVCSGSAFPEACTLGWSLLRGKGYRAVEVRACFGALEALGCIERLGAFSVRLTVAIAAAAAVPAATTSAAITTLQGTAAVIRRGSDCAFKGGSFAAATLASIAAGSTIAVAGGIEVGGVAGLFHKVGDIEEGIALEADVHEGGLHAGKHAGHFTVVDGAGERVFVLALVIDLG
jgi:hypothetical protein